MATDTSEKGLETLIVRHLADIDGLLSATPVGTGTATTTDIASRLITPLGGTVYLTETLAGQGRN